MSPALAGVFFPTGTTWEAPLVPPSSFILLDGDAVCLWKIWFRFFVNTKYFAEMLEGLNWSFLLL